MEDKPKFLPFEPGDVPNESNQVAHVEKDEYKHNNSCFFGEKVFSLA